MRWFKDRARTFVESAWIPLVVVLISILVAGIGTVAWWFYPLPQAIALVPLLMALIMTLLATGAAAYNLFQRRWYIGGVQLISLPIGIVGVSEFFIFVLMISLFGPSEDHFADDLSIPDDVTIADTDPDQNGGEYKTASNQDAHEPDAFQSRLLKALDRPRDGSPEVHAEVGPLRRLHKHYPDLLRRYLAASPAWRVFREKGERFATRRWKRKGTWRYTLHGYYSGRFGDPSSNGSPFETRLTIGLSGAPWYSGDDTTVVDPGERSRLELSTPSDGYGTRISHLVIRARDLAVEVFEQTRPVERRLTEASLAHLRKELAPLGESPDWSTARTLLPPEAIRTGSPRFRMRKSSQPGIFDAWIRANPGESGRIYLKAFEVKQGTRLSATRLRDRSNEWSGWSNDPEEKFLSNTHFTIYEGDWGDPYSARFEVWFVPDDGGPERKLMEKVFKIEGWQR